MHPFLAAIIMAAVIVDACVFIQVDPFTALAFAVFCTAGIVGGVVAQT